MTANESDIQQAMVASQNAQKQAYSNPINAYGSSIMFLTNPREQLRDLEMTYKNCVTDSSGNILQIGEPLMNDKGISSVVGQVQSIVNRVTVMSNLNIREILILNDALADTLAKDLMMNRKVYDIKNLAARDKIHSTAVCLSFICMKRAQEEGEKRFWKGSQQDITTRIENQNKRGSFFNWHKG